MLIWYQGTLIVRTVLLVAEREEGRLRNEMKRIQNDLNELDSRRNIAEVISDLRFM